MERFSCRYGDCATTWASIGRPNERVQRDEVLSEVVRSVVITTTDLESKYAPEHSEMSCLSLRFVPGWLFGISVSRVKEEIREKLMRYRRECFDVLWDAFKADILPALIDIENQLAAAYGHNLNAIDNLVNVNYNVIVG